MSSVQKICAMCNKTEAELSGNLKHCARCKEAFYCSRDCQTADWKSHKTACVVKFDESTPVTTTPYPAPSTTTLILAVDDMNFVRPLAETIIRKIEQKSRVLYADTPESALDLIGGGTGVTAIFVIDASPTMQKYKKVSNKIFQFVQGGGTLILAALSAPSFNLSNYMHTLTKSGVSHGRTARIIARLFS